VTESASCSPPVAESMIESFVSSIEETPKKRRTPPPPTPVTTESALSTSFSPDAESFVPESASCSPPVAEPVVPEARMIAPPVNGNDALGSGAHVATSYVIPTATPCPSFPTSPAPRVGSLLTPTLGPPHTYIDTQYTPVERDYGLDYEAVMTSVEDMNRLSRFMFRGGVRRVRCGNRFEMYTQQDVLPVLQELRDMLNRLFSRLNG